MDTDNQFLFLKTLNGDGNYYDNTNFLMQRPILLDNERDHEHEMGMLKLTCKLSMVNIPTGTTFTFTLGATPYIVPLRGGNYDVATLESELQYYMFNNGLTALISFTPNFNDGKMAMRLSPTVSVDFTNPTNAIVGRVLGFTALINNVLLIDQIYYAPNAAQFNVYYDANGQTREINHLYFHCNLFNKLSYTNLDSDTIRTNNNSIVYSTPLTGQAGTIITNERNENIYMRLMTIKNIDTFNIYITNEKNEKLNGVMKDPVYIELHIRKRAK